MHFFPWRQWCALGLTIFASALGAPRAAAQTNLTAADFFDDGVVHEIRLTIRSTDWQLLKQHYLENTYYPANFQWRGQTVQNVGIRSRGRGSRSPVKPNFRVDFNRYEEQQEFLGLKSCILKANNQDASFLKERLAFLLFQRMGLPASRQAHARVYVNNEYAGLYLLTEEVDKRFLKRIFDEDEGYLYEFKPRNEGYRFEYLGPDPALYSPVLWDPKTHETDPDPRPIVDMVRTINQSSDADFPRAVAGYLDVKLFVTHVAIENFLAEYDGILGDVFGMNNFFFYRFKGKNLSQFIVWDKDGAFNFLERPIFQGANDNVLMRKALAISEVRSAYLEALGKIIVLVGGPGGWLEQEISREYNQIRTAALEDPVKQKAVGGVQKPASNEDFENEVVYVRKFTRDRPEFVRRELAAAGFQLSSGAPRLNEGGVANAAPGGSVLLSPGSLVSLYGDFRLGDTTAQAPLLPLPTTLAGVSVSVNGFLAPLLYVSSGQMNLQAPWEIGAGSVPFTVFFQKGTLGNTVNANVVLFSPGVFAVVTYPDNSLTTVKPAGGGDVLIVYANGLGAVDIPVVTGQAAPFDKLANTRDRPVVTVGGAAAKVLFSGFTPGFVGLYQINMEMPAGVAAGTSTPLVVSIGGQSSPPVPIVTR